MLQNIANFLFGAEKCTENQLEDENPKLEIYNEDEWIIVVEKNESELEGRASKKSVQNENLEDPKNSMVVISHEIINPEVNYPEPKASQDERKSPINNSVDNQVFARNLTDVRDLCEKENSWKTDKTFKMKSNNDDNKKKSLNRLNKNTKVVSKQIPERKYNINLRYSSKSERTC